MNPFISGIIVGVTAVLVLDTLGSIMSKWLSFPYSRLSLIFLALWAMTAAIASQSGESALIKSTGLGWAAGLIVGLVDSTLGWWISWQLGASRLKPELASPRVIARVISKLTLRAGAIGALGAFLRALIVKGI